MQGGQFPAEILYNGMWGRYLPVKGDSLFLQIISHELTN
jgi:hypothetical protein